MKVLMLSDFYPPIVGGMEGHVQLLSRKLSDRGHEVTVCTTGGAGPTSVDANGIRVFRIRGIFQRMHFLYGQTEKPYPPPVQDPALTQKIKEIIETARPDLIHSHGWILYSVLPLRKKCRTPLIVTLHDYGLICPKKSFLTKHKNICEIPLTRNCIGCGTDAYGLLKSVSAYCGVRSGTRTLSQVDRYVAVSRFVRETYSRHLPSIGHNIVVIPNFYEEQMHTSDIDRSWSFPENFILFVGTLTHIKGIDVLFSAFRRLPGKTRLLVVGNRDPRFQFRTVESVTVIERPAIRSGPDVLIEAAYRRCRFVVVPSIGPEPCPTVAFEAMNATKAVVGFDVGGLKDIVVNNETGILVPRGNVEALSSAMTRLLENPSESAKMGVAGHSRLRNLFSPEVNIPRIEKEYYDVVQAAWKV